MSTVTACKKVSQCRAIMQRGGKSEWCQNCGYKFMDEVSHAKKPTIKALKDGFFKVCSDRTNPRARVEFKKPFKKLFQDRFPYLNRLTGPISWLPQNPQLLPPTAELAKSMNVCIFKC